MATESRKHETSDKLTVQSLAWAVWQVLGWDWGLNPGKEKSRICNWFWDVSRGEDRPLSELFPLGGEQRLSDAQPKVLEARPGVSTAVEGNTVDKSESGVEMGKVNRVEAIVKLKELLQRTGNELDGWRERVVISEREEEKLRKEVEKLRKQAEGQCDGCGKDLDDAFCMKCKDGAEPGPTTATAAEKLRNIPGGNRMLNENEKELLRNSELELDSILQRKINGGLE